MANKEDEYKRLRTFLNKSIAGPNTDAILKSLASGPVYLIDNIEAVNDSLYVVSAQGKYLDTRLGDKGVVRPAEVGLSDEVFRDIGIEITNRKQVRDLVHQLLRILYGDIYTRATSTSQEVETFSLEDGDSLIVSFDGSDSIELTFAASQFDDINNATAQEVADAITKTIRKLGAKGSAFTVQDGADTKVVLISSTDGPSSTVRVLGGKAQNALKFDEIRPTSNGSTTQWTLTQEAGGTIKATWTGGADPSLGKVKVGDYVTIYGTSFDLANRGTFTIVDVLGGVVGVSYVEFENPNGIPETVIQGGITSIPNETFFADFNTSKTATRGNGDLIPETDIGGVLSAGSVELFDISYPPPYKTLEFKSQDNINLGGNTQIEFVAYFDYNGLPPANNLIAYIGDSNAGGNNQVVIRHTPAGDLQVFVIEDSGAYKVIISRPFSPVIGQKYNITLTLTPDGSSNNLYIDGSSVGNSFSSNLPYTVNNSLVDRITLSGDTTNIDRYGTVAFDWFQIKDDVLITGDFTSSLSEPIPPTGVAGDDAMLFYNPKTRRVTSEERFAGAFQTDARTLEVFVPATTKIVRRNRAGAAHIYESGPSNEGQEGPFLYDTELGYVIGEQAALTTEELDVSSDSILFVDDASQFPDESGNIIIGLGTSHQEGPVPYISKPSDQTLRINPSYKFKKDHPIGTDIALIAQNSPATPNKDGSDFPFFLTDSVAGRLYAERLINEITATGIVVIIYVLYPNDIGLGKGGDQENSEKYYIWGTEEDL